ncbi:MAG: ATP-binding cassette domain-containing protein [Firmicutes bacterium]|nr:ATP-binding cassette domain-containing protein [Bacillota bacterium]
MSAPKPSATLSIEQVSLGTDPLRLRGIDLRIRKGELTLLVGDTGAGKTSLLETVAGLWAPAKGQVYISDHPLYIGAKPNTAALRNVSLAMQHAEKQLFAPTVQAELFYSLQIEKDSTREDRMARCVEALMAVSLSPDLLPMAPLHLSGGQKRKVALASALVTKPQWLMMDEPTAALDSASAEQVVSSTVRLVRDDGIGLLVATHDLDLWLPHADRVIMLSGGQVMADYSREQKTIPANGYLSASQFTSCAQVTQALAHEDFNVAPQDTSPKALAEAVVAKLYGASISAAENISSSPMQETHVAREGIAVALDLESLSHTYDPRALWLSYLLLSTSILLQTGWVGLLVGLLAIIWWLRGLSVPVWRSFYGARGFIVFLLLASLVAGVQIHLAGLHKGGHLASALGIDTHTSLQSTYTLARIFLLLIGGFALSGAVPFLRMKRALRQLLHFGAPLGLPVEAVALGGALTVRFVPVIAQEAERMRQIVFLRGKRTQRRNVLRLRDLRAFAIPLLLAILQSAEDFATALEARGYHTDTAGADDLSSHWQRADWVLLGQIAVLMILLLCVRNWIP